MNTILFDIDMTLITTNGAGRATIKSTLETVLGNATPMESISVHGKTDSWIYTEALKQLGIKIEQKVLQTLYETHIQLLPRELEKRDGKILNGVTSLLQKLSQHPVTLGLATGNLAKGAEIKLQHFGLWEQFSGGGFGDLHKERSAIVQEALQSCNSEASNTIVIGDTPWDISSGKAVGTRTVGVATGIFEKEELTESGADLIVDTLEATEELFEFLLARNN